MAVTRGRMFLVALLASSLAAGAVAYRKWPQLLNRFRRQPVVTSTVGDQRSSIPPFSTKEPDRYQATRVLTEIEKLADGSLSPASTEKVLIARDGENRREEIHGLGGVTVYLETAAGQFALLPEKKIYAAVTTEGGEGGEVSPASELTNFSPERLLHETSAIVTYQKVGSESLDGRATTKYRVTEDNGGGQPEGTTTLIWVDDDWGLPVKTETSSNSAIMTTELKDIRLEVDPQIFELPKDYRKVDFATFSKEKSLKVNLSGQPAAKSKEQ